MPRPDRSRAHLEGIVSHASLMSSAYRARPASAATPYSCVMVDPPTFGELITDGRHRKGLTQEDLERLTGISRSTLSRWERGQADRPEPEHVRAACAALDIDPRRAAVALGYLSVEEAGFTSPTGPPIDPEIDDVLRLLPRVPAANRSQWIDYLRYLVERQEQGKQGKNAS